MQVTIQAVDGGRERPVVTAGVVEVFSILLEARVDVAQLGFLDGERDAVIVLEQASAHRELCVALQRLAEIKPVQPAVPAFANPVMLAELFFISAHRDPSHHRDCVERESADGGRDSAPREILIDPCAQRRGLRSRDWIALAHGWHFHVFHQARDVVNEWAVRAVAGNHRLAVLAALEHRVTRVHAETAFGFLRPVTAQAARLQNWLDVAHELNAIGGGRGEFN